MMAEVGWLAIAALVTSATGNVVVNGGPAGASGSMAEVTQVYKEGGRLVGYGTLDLAQAEQKCPNGHELRRQETRAEGDKVLLVSTLRCR